MYTFHPAIFQHTHMRSGIRPPIIIHLFSPPPFCTASRSPYNPFTRHTRRILSCIYSCLSLPSPHTFTRSIQPYHLALHSQAHSTTPLCNRPTHLHTRTQQPVLTHMLPTLPRYMHRSLGVAVGMRVPLAMRRAAAEAQALASVLLVVIRTKEVVAERATIQPIVPRGG